MSNRRTKSSSGTRERDAEIISEALAILSSGEVAVFPTETFYGLGADAFNESAVERVASLKGRDPENPIPLIISDKEMLTYLVADLPVAAQRLMEHFWPGPLTLVLPAREGLSNLVQNRNGGVGIRISSHPIAAALVQGLGRPLTATSANPSGKTPARTLAEAQAYFSGRVKVFVDGGELKGKKGSTVLEMTRNKIKIIREGEIGLQELEQVLAGSC